MPLPDFQDGQGSTQGIEWIVDIHAMSHVAACYIVVGGDATRLEAQRGAVSAARETSMQAGMAALTIERNKRPHMIVSRQRRGVPRAISANRPWSRAVLGALLVVAVVVMGMVIWIRASSTPSGPGPVIQTSPIGPYPEALLVDGHTARGFVIHQDGTVDVLDTTNGQVVRRVMVGPFGYTPSDAAVAEQAGHVFVASAGTVGQGMDVSVLDARSGAVLGVTRVGRDRHGVAVDEQRGRAIVGMRTGIAILAARTGRVPRLVNWDATAQCYYQ